MTKNNIIKLDAGFESFDLEFKGLPERMKISFVATDYRLAAHFKQMQNAVSEKLQEAPDFDIDDNGMPDGAEYIQYMNELDNFVCEQLDRCFGIPISKELFKYCSPFAIINGERYVTQVIIRLAEVIQQATERQRREEMKKFKEKMQHMKPHLEKYAK